MFRSLSNCKEYEVYGTYYKNFKVNLIFFDYLSSESFNKIIRISPDFIIWCAGSKNLIKTEVSLNFSITENFFPIKNTLQKINGKITPTFIFLSTDYVFDGSIGNYSIDDIPIPKSFYGKSKLRSEKYIQKSWNDYYIIRAGSILGKESVFLKWLIKSLKSKKEIILYDNLFTPTPIINLNNLIIDIVNSKISDRLIHVTGYEKLSRMDLGKFIAEALNSKTILKERPHSESEVKFFYDLSLKNSYNSEKNISCKEFIDKLLK